MIDNDTKAHLDAFHERLGTTLTDMDESDATDGTFDCPACQGIVRVKLIPNRDAYAYCETDKCFQTGLIHRHMQDKRRREARGR